MKRVGDNRMKLLSVAIPSYNSEAYMSHAIETLLTGGDEIEIIIVNDGSSDRTAQIADEYEQKYPNIIKAIHQVNGGHGEAVNTGLKYASGLYYKVVDSDDWVNEEALQKMMAAIREHVEKNEMIDLYLANYVYEKVAIGKQKVMRYTSVFPENQVFGWDEVGNFGQSQFVIMHSVIYRTQMLRECGLTLPKHTFYVDNIFVYNPMPYVKTMFYLNIDLYRYFIGRDDQSVNEKVMIGRMDQQLRVTRQMIDQTDITTIDNKKLKQYLVKYMTMMMTICTVFLLKKGTQEAVRQKEEIWKYLKTEDPHMYEMVSKTLLGRAIQMKGSVGKRIIFIGYSITQKIFGYN